MSLEINDPADLIDRHIGPLTILFGYENGKYPHGNSLLIRGSNQAVIVDPCLGVVARKERLPLVDAVFHSHTHEDHIAGTHLFRDVPWYAHELDAQGLEAFLRERLADYKVPRTYEFRSDLPRNALGKVLKRVLREEERP